MSGIESSKAQMLWLFSILSDSNALLERPVNKLHDRHYQSAYENSPLQAGKDHH